MKPAFNGVELGIVLVLFVFVTVMGFLAARWKRSGTLAHRRMGPRRTPIRNVGDLVPRRR